MKITSSPGQIVNVLEAVAIVAGVKTAFAIKVPTPKTATVICGWVRLGCSQIVPPRLLIVTIRYLVVVVIPVVGV